MELNFLFYFLAFLFLLIFSAFFSGSETALFSLSPSQIEKYKKSSGKAEQRLSQLLSKPRRLLITILIGNTMVNIAIASLAVILTTQLSYQFGLNEIVIVLLDVVAVTFVILILSEILPKVVAVRNAETFSKKVSVPLTLFYYTIFPVSNLLSHLTQFIQEHSGFAKNKMLLTEDELRTLAEVGEEQGALQKDEREMIHSIFEFGETTVKEVMVPRPDMVVVNTETTLSQLMELMKIKLHSRIPVYKERIENIVGILYVKDLLHLLSKQKHEPINLEKLVRPAYFVPEQKKIDELLKEFQSQHIHLAIVVDEYGGVSGLVTLEDIIEEIVGEIQDEYDKEAPLFQQISDDTFIVDGRISLEEMNQELDLNLPTEEGFDTISGFILNMLGSVPKEKEKLSYQHTEYTVEKIYRNRILKVRVKKNKPEVSKTKEYE